MNTTCLGVCRRGPAQVHQLPWRRCDSVLAGVLRSESFAEALVDDELGRRLSPCAARRSLQYLETDPRDESSASAVVSAVSVPVTTRRGMAIAVALGAVAGACARRSGARAVGVVCDPLAATTAVGRVGRSAGGHPVGRGVLRVGPRVGRLVLPVHDRGQPDEVLRRQLGPCRSPSPAWAAALPGPSPARRSVARSARRHECCPAFTAGDRTLLKWERRGGSASRLTEIAGLSNNQANV